jgi:hypothetical protein
MVQVMTPLSELLHRHHRLDSTLKLLLLLLL